MFRRRGLLKPTTFARPASARGDLVLLEELLDRHRRRAEISCDLRDRQAFVEVQPPEELRVVVSLLPPHHNRTSKRSVHGSGVRTRRSNRSPNSVGSSRRNDKAFAIGPLARRGVSSQRRPPPGIRSRAASRHASARTRTENPLIKSQLLYQLSYRGEGGNCIAERRFCKRTSDAPSPARRDSIAPRFGPAESERVRARTARRSRRPSHEAAWSRRTESLGVSEHRRGHRRCERWRDPASPGPRAEVTPTCRGTA